MSLMALYFAVAGVFYKMEEVEHASDIAGILVCMVSAVVLRPLGRRMNRVAIEITRTDGSVTRGWQIRNMHTLYWIPVQHWSAIYLAMAGFIAFHDHFTS